MTPSEYATDTHSCTHDRMYRHIPVGTYGTNGQKDLPTATPCKHGASLQASHHTAMMNFAAQAQSRRQTPMALRQLEQPSRSQPDVEAPWRCRSRPARAHEDDPQLATLKALMTSLLPRLPAPLVEACSPLHGAPLPQPRRPSTNTSHTSKSENVDRISTHHQPPLFCQHMHQVSPLTSATPSQPSWSTPPLLKCNMRGDLHARPPTAPCTRTCVRHQSTGIHPNTMKSCTPCHLQMYA